LNGEIETGDARIVIEGFYCQSDEPFAPGEHLRLEISIPSKGGEAPGKCSRLFFLVKVLRVELNGVEAGFGITLQLEETEPVCGERRGLIPQKTLSDLV
jgi:hypothetical protein